MAGKSKSKDSFGARLARLEQIVERLESEEIDLEDALTAFEEGVKLSRELTVSLTSASRRVELLLRQENGEFALAPFDPGLDEVGDEKDKEADDADVESDEL
ncbi:MAG: exodeoxyribonuclease VII small subunit [Deltaproteobacteria bacterium]|nr:exodeoxyribonuclease VII small subunit [Deltaproteobacteria bacterium]